MWIQTDTDGRIIASSPDTKIVGGREVDPPDGWDAEHQQDWRLVDGIPTHDPEPEPEVIPTPTMGERMAAVEVGQETQDTAIDELVQVMADMIGGAV